MKTIEVDEELYRYLASHTQHIGESASDILRRMLNFKSGQPVHVKELGNEHLEDSVQTKNTLVVPRNPVRVVRELLLSNAYSEKKQSD